MVEAGSRRSRTESWAFEHGSGPPRWALARPPSDAQRLDAALAAALEQIRAPAFVLSEQGEIREANGAGQRRLSEDAAGVAELLRESTLDDEERAFDVTPLLSGGAEVGFLAVERLSAARLLSLRDQRVSMAARRWALTPRQSQVLSLVAEGATNRRVAAQLGISERTTEDHVAAILLRAGVRTRAELIAGLLGDLA